jgi:hypothetical protein
MYLHDRIIFLHQFTAFYFTSQETNPGVKEASHTCILNPFIFQLSERILLSQAM